MEDHKSEYRLRPKARNDMEAVWVYSLAKWGFSQTERYIDDLTSAFDFLAKSPKAGRACDNIRAGYRKYLVIRHVIYYRETDNGIEIIRVLHDRILAPRHL